MIRSKRSRHATLRTLALAGAVFATALVVGRAAADTVDLSWTAPGDDGTIGRAATYAIRYAATPVTGSDSLAWWNAATTAGVLPPPLTAGSRERFTVLGLTTGATYYFMIRTADEVPNWSGFSNISVRQAGAVGTPLATVADLVATQIAAGVRLTWSEPASGGGEGYRVYRRVPGGADSLLGARPLAQPAYTDSSAAPGASYEYRVATYQGATEGIPAVAAITLSAAPPPTVIADLQGYPNPARDRVTLRFMAGTADGSPGRVRVVVFDLTGHRICALLDDVLPAGERTIEWGCRSDTGVPVAPGVYNVIVDAPLGRRVTQLAIVP